jgi:AcrR family transcriptional regulator
MKKPAAHAKRKPIAARRDPDDTKRQILDALARLILRDGLSAVGINALAREAGCDKVLIYRYFEDLDGVYEAFAASREFGWTVEELTDGIDPKTMPALDILKLLLRRHAEAMRARPVTLAVLAEEAANRTPLVIALETVREHRGLALNDWIARSVALPRGVDFAAVSTILSTAATYLAMRARKIRVMGGVLIKTDKDWERIYDAFDTLIDGLAAPRTRKSG